MYPPISYVVYVQTDTLNFTFAQKAVLRIYIYLCGYCHYDKTTL